MYYRNCTDTVVKVGMHPRRFVGFAWHVGDPMTFKVIHCYEDPKKRVQILHRGVVIPRSLSESGYNSALQPNSDAYFPEVRTEGGANIKTAPSLHKVIVDPPNIFMTEGGRKRRKLLSSSPRHVGTDRSTVAPIETVTENPSIVDDVPVPDNIGYVNEEGATDDMYWSEMGQEEVQDQLNYAENLTFA